MNEVTRLLSALDQGDPLAAQQLLPLIYDELHRVAAQLMAREKPGQTLQATALVHEAYLRLAVGSNAPAANEPHWDNRRHFFAAAAEAMRRILVENARRKKALKNGGRFEQVPLDQVDVALPVRSDDLLALDEALTLLAAERPIVADLVKLRFFAGMTMEEASQTLDISPATAYRHWNYAQAWLFRAISAGE